MQIVRELGYFELMFTLITMLIGQEGREWSYYKNDAGWWRDRLYTRRN